MTTLKDAIRNGLPKGTKDERVDLVYAQVRHHLGNKFGVALLLCDNEEQETLLKILFKALLSPEGVDLHEELGMKKK